MADQKLMAYISQNFGRLGEDGVRKKLLETGWDANSVNQAISEYKSQNKAQSTQSTKSPGKGLPMNTIMIIVAVVAVVGAVATVLFMFPDLIQLPGPQGPSGPSCGDGTCDSGETYTSCPADCEEPGPQAYCGDGTCDSDESYDNCPDDCEKPPPSPITLTVTGPSSGSSGGTVSYDIMASGAKYFFGFQFNVEYDPDILEYSSIVEGDFLNSNGADSTFCVPVNTGTAGQIRNFACTRMKSGNTVTGVEGSGTLATVTFNAVGSGTSDISLTNVKLADIDAEEIPASVTDTSVTIS